MFSKLNVRDKKDVPTTEKMSSEKTEKKCLAQGLDIEICPSSVVDCGSGNKLQYLDLNNSWLHSCYDIELLPGNSRFDYLEKLNLFSLTAMELACKNDGGRGCAGEVSSLSQNKGSCGCGNHRAGVCWWTVHDGWWFFNSLILREKIWCSNWKEKYVQGECWTEVVGINKLKYLGCNISW